MFTEKPVYGKLAELLFSFLASGKRRGDVVTYDDIQRQIGYAKYSREWVAIVGKVRRQLIDKKGIVLRAVPTVGFELLLPHEQVEHVTQSRVRKRIRQTYREERELESLPASELDIHYQHGRAMALEKCRAHRKIMTADKRAHMALLAPAGTLPRG